MTEQEYQNIKTDIITNVNPKDRDRVLDVIKQHIKYKPIAVYYETPEEMTND